MMRVLRVLIQSQPKARKVIESTWIPDTTKEPLEAAPKQAYAQVFSQTADLFSGEEGEKTQDYKEILGEETIVLVSYYFLTNTRTWIYCGKQLNVQILGSRWSLLLHPSPLELKGGGHYPDNCPDSYRLHE